MKVKTQDKRVQVGVVLCDDVINGMVCVCDLVGVAVGIGEGPCVGEAVGAYEGVDVGAEVGLEVGVDVGAEVGSLVEKNDNNG